MNTKKFKPLLPVVQANLCDGCSACCNAMAVHELNKPVSTKCVHQCATGCAIYPKRPPSCRTFKCLWRMGDIADQNGQPSFALRPDNLGLVLWYQAGTIFGSVILTAQESRKGAFEEPNARATLDSLAAQTLVMLIRADSRKLMGPPHMLHAAALKIQEGVATGEIEEGSDL